MKPLMKTMKIQANRENTFVNIPREMVKELDLKKGETVLLKLIEGKIVISK